MRKWSLEQIFPQLPNHTLDWTIKSVKAVRNAQVQVWLSLIQALFRKSPRGQSRLGSGIKVLILY